MKAKLKRAEGDTDTAENTVKDKNENSKYNEKEMGVLEDSRKKWELWKMGQGECT